jgi:carbonic anhydrase
LQGDKLKTMQDLSNLLKKNRAWAARVEAEQPGFFKSLSQQQSPEILWIGCSDSRVPATEIVDLLPGEIFVHRNIANMVIHTDLNCLSVLQFAVDVLRVRHVIVCGHYGCGGVKAALENKEHGLIDNWLRHVRDVRRLHRKEIDELGSYEDRCDALCEINVREQVLNVCHTTIVQQAWKNSQELNIHGWIYNVADGIIKDMGVTASCQSDISRVYRTE